MDSLQVLNALHHLSGAVTTGVVPADMVPKAWTKPMALVINLDDHTRPGSHWVAVYFDTSGRGHYFDSYGIPPLHPVHLDALRRNCKIYEWNKEQFQSISSNVCGQFCIMYLYHMCYGGTIKSFSKFFSDEFTDNDRIVDEFHKGLLKNYVSKNTHNQAGNGGSKVYIQQCYPRKY